VHSLAFRDFHYDPTLAAEAEGLVWACVVVCAGELLRRRGALIRGERVAR
jgi:hypothetical protein